jgi:hypothetical protein
MPKIPTQQESLSFINADAAAIERTISWYDKETEELVGEAKLSNFDLSVLQKLWNEAPQYPMVDPHYIETKEQIAYIERLIGIELNLNIYDYFLECWGK